MKRERPIGEIMGSCPGLMRQDEIEMKFDHGQQGQESSYFYSAWGLYNKWDSDIL